MERAVSSTQFVPLGTATGFRVTPRMAALALPLILTLGFVLRIGATWTQTYILFFDETLQYFEQGHRLAFDSCIVPWEFIEGIRSWLLPGLIALVMRGSAWFSDSPMLYIGAVRLACVALSMTIVFVGFRAGQRHGGLMGAIVTGGFCAIWFDLIYFAPAVMTEVLAAHCAIAALFLGEGARTPRRVFWIAALFGLAVCLRYQYAPALALAVAFQYWRDRSHWQWLFLGGTAVLLPFSGVLDAITWGGAFQSIWLNFARNSLQGVAAAIGTEPWHFYLDYLMIALLPLPLFLGLAAAGATRFPALGIVAAATVVMHSLVPHKEPRFIYLALAAAPILIGLGVARVLRLWSERRGPGVVHVGVPCFLAFGALVSWYIATTPLAGRWSFQRGTVHVFLAAHEAPGLCGLQVRGIPIWKSGGYTYLHRDVPLMFDPPVPEVRLPGVAMPLRFRVERTGGPVPQMRSPYSHVIAEAARPPAGLETLACFPDDARPGEPELCLYRRPDGCF